MVDNVDAKQIFFVNSFDRIYGTPSDFIIELRLNTVKKQKNVCVMSANIPKTYYNAPVGQNYFTVIENGVPTVITITPANYSRRSLEIELAAQLNATASYTYTISYPNASQPDTGKFTYTVSANIDQPTFVMPDNHFAEFLGFDRGSSNTFSANTLVSQNVIRLQREEILLIHSDIGTNNIDNLDSVIAEVYSSNVPTYSNINYESGNYAEAYILKRELRQTSSFRYRFYLTDESGNSIDLNGNDWTFQLAIW